MDRDELIEERQAHNLAETVECGPGLRHTTRTWVLAKDTEAGMVYVGGLGSMGVGRMWTKAFDRDVNDPTYAEAPEAKCPESIVAVFRDL